MHENRLNTLFNNYMEGQINANELLELQELVNNQNYDQKLNELIAASFKHTDFTAVNELAKERVRNSLMTSISPAQHKPAVMWKRFAAAVSIAACFVLGIYLFADNETSNDYGYDVAPGKSGATLSLGNGKSFALAGEKHAIVVNGAAVRYADGSALETANQNQFVIYTASTDKGNTYQLTLPDGSKVWLNAGSSLQFPSQFTGKTRSVTLSGEGYFEVAKITTPGAAKRIPFIVKTAQQEVLVLGTHFNIKAYTDEPTTKTTLLEGSVKVTSSPLSSSPDFSSRAKAIDLTLKPNQQAVLNNNILSVQPADAQEAVAWKNGEFDFNSENIKSIMTTLARWYDIEVVYNGIPPETTFTGKISRNRNIGQVLHMLEKTKSVHFKIIPGDPGKGRRVVVMQ